MGLLASKAQWRILSFESSHVNAQYFASWLFYLDPPEIDPRHMHVSSSGASLVAQMVKNLPAVQATSVWSLDQEDPLDKGMAYPLQYSHLENSADRGAWWTRVHGVSKESDITWWLNNNNNVLHIINWYCYLFYYIIYKYIYFQLYFNAKLSCTYYFKNACWDIWLLLCFSHKWLDYSSHTSFKVWTYDFAQLCSRSFCVFEGKALSCPRCAQHETASSVFFGGLPWRLCPGEGDPLWSCPPPFSYNQGCLMGSPSTGGKYIHLIYNVTRAPWLRLLLSAQMCLTLCNTLDCSPPCSSVHSILQARILKWVVISFSRGSSWPRDRTCVFCVSCIAGRFFTLNHLGFWNVSPWMPFN